MQCTHIWKHAVFNTITNRCVHTYPEELLFSIKQEYWYVSIWNFSSVVLELRLTMDKQMLVCCRPPFWTWKAKQKHTLVPRSFLPSIKEAPLLQTKHFIAATTHAAQQGCKRGRAFLKMPRLCLTLVVVTTYEPIQWHHKVVEKGMPVHIIWKFQELNIKGRHSHSCVPALQWQPFQRACKCPFTRHNEAGNATQPSSEAFRQTAKSWPILSPVNPGENSERNQRPGSSETTQTSTNKTDPYVCHSRLMMNVLKLECQC